MTIALLFLFFILIIVLLFRAQASETELADERSAHQKVKEELLALQLNLDIRGQRIDHLLSMFSEVIVRLDKHGSVLGGNKAAFKLFEFDKFPDLPQSMLLFFRDHDWLFHFHQGIRQLPSQHELPEMHFKDRIFLPRLAPLGDDELVMLCLDVTAYVRLQKQQKSLLANLMHDLKTPLTSLLGYARSIETFMDDAELRQEAAAVIAKEAKYLSQLMNNMLTLEQLDFQNKRNDGESDVMLVLKNIWTSLEFQMQQKNISLAMAIELESYTVNMDEEDCYRVLMNIAENAIKYGPTNANIYCSIVSVNGDIKILIEDEGVGIADKHLNRVVERFYRIDDARGRNATQKGHGLGLAIVKEILERHGGKLELSNREEGGLAALITMQGLH